MQELLTHLAKPVHKQGSPKREHTSCPALHSVGDCRAAACAVSLVKAFAEQRPIKQTWGPLLQQPLSVNVESTRNEKAEVYQR